MKKKSYNYKFIIGIIIGLLLVSGVYAASYIGNATELSYDNTTSGLSSSNVQEALDELYNMKDNMNCPKGYVCELDLIVVSYDANGGTGAPDSQIKTEGVDLILSSIIPTRPSFQFLGWSTNSSATSSEYSAGGTYTYDEDITLYAIWRYSGGGGGAD